MGRYKDPVAMKGDLTKFEPTNILVFPSPHVNIRALMEYWVARGYILNTTRRGNICLERVVKRRRKRGEK